jgi:hypothetical protein
MDAYLSSCPILLSILVLMIAVEAGFVVYLLGLWLSHRCPH